MRTRINDDAEQYALQIELDNDCAVLLTFWKNGDPPDASLWLGSLSRDLNSQTPEGVRHWVGLATGGPEGYAAFRKWCDEQLAQGAKCACCGKPEHAGDPQKTVTDL